MKGKLLFGAGLAAGYVLGSRSGRAAYEKLKSRTTDLWHSKPVQDKLTAAAERSRTRRPRSPSSSAKPPAAQGRSLALPSTAMRGPNSKTGNTSSGIAPKPSIAVAPDVSSDPALTDQDGQDWSDEGGATPAGPATNIEADKLP